MAGVWFSEDNNREEGWGHPGASHNIDLNKLGASQEAFNLCDQGRNHGGIREGVGGACQRWGERAYVPTAQYSHSPTVVKGSPFRSWRFEGAMKDHRV